MVDLPHSWLEYLVSQRWFAGKDRQPRVAGWQPLGWHTPAGSLPAVRSELLEVGYPDGPTQTYHLLAGYLPASRTPGASAVSETKVPGLGPVAVVDAPLHPDLMTLVFEHLNQDPPTGFSWLDPVRFPPGATTRLFAGEQSHTIVFAGPLLFKLFRKVDPEPNLEIEMLTALRDTGLTPGCHGVLRSPDQRFDLGLVMENVANEGDGWTLALASCATNRDFSQPASRLGESLARLHQALGLAFPTHLTESSLIEAELVRRFDQAVASAPPLSQFRPFAHRLHQRLPQGQVPQQRIHGDFHLGQTLLRPDGSWVIIDFEGEPARTPQERRAPDCPMRDVAGMVRSFDYASRSATGDLDAASRRAWRDAATTAFLDGYQGVGELDMGLLEAFKLDKASYEVGYEIRNRPDWVQIPMQAVAEQAKMVSRNPSSPRNEVQ